MLYSHTGLRSEQLHKAKCGNTDVECFFAPSTAIILPATPRLGQSCETQLRAIHLERAGLLDAETMSFTPALRIDYNFYQITAVTITDSLSDGVHINYIYPYETARLEYMQVRQYVCCCLNFSPCGLTFMWWGCCGLCLT